MYVDRWFAVSLRYAGAQPRPGLRAQALAPQALFRDCGPKKPVFVPGPLIQHHPATQGRPCSARAMPSDKRLGSSIAHIIAAN
jgi:hypothetical protein